jgi:hypothetical protein
MSTPHTTPGDDRPMTNVFVAISGAGGSEHESLPPGADGRAVKAGHEPDKFAVRAILYVPALLVLTMLVAFAVVTAVILTYYTRYKPADPASNPQAGQLTNADINDRFGRISSTVPKDLKTRDGEVIKDSAVPQPRLEYLKQTQPETPTDPAYLRSKRPTNSPSNSPEIRPEDLRAENYVDPLTRERVLATYGWRNVDHSVARVPINEAIKMVIAQHKLPVKKGAAPATPTTDDRAKLSNAGRGGLSDQPVPRSPKPDAPKGKDGH